MSTKVIAIIFIVGIIIVGGGAVLLLSRNSKSQVNNSIDKNEVKNENMSQTLTNQPITYNEKGFSPTSKTVAANSDVVFINNTKSPLIIKYDDSSLPATLVIPHSTTNSPNFKKKGIYKYISTDQPSFGGEIIVE